MKITKLNNIIRIEHKTRKIRDGIKFWDKVQELIKEGYVVNPAETIRQAPKFIPYIRVDFIKPENITTKAPVKKEVLLLKEVEKLSGKEELLRFAEKNEITIPEEKVNPSAIKKYLKGFLNNDI
jgi:hypothetical protein